MPQPVPYLAFDGNCAEAMRFYAHTLDGKLGLLTAGQSPFADQCPPEHHGRVMHARLELTGGMFIYGGDCQVGMPYQGIHGVSLALSYDDVGDAERVFAALAEGGTVTMPLSPAFWAEMFGMVTDKFGCHWIVNGAPIEVTLQG